MATNRELSEQARDLGKRLNVQVNTEGLSSSALQELVADLQTKAAAAEAQPKQGPKEDPSVKYTVTGKTLVTARGVIDSNGEIRPEDVGGQKQLDELIEKGYVKKGTREQKDDQARTVTNAPEKAAPDKPTTVDKP
jgi:hypothetical protein